MMAADTFAIGAHTETHPASPRPRPPERAWRYVILGPGSRKNWADRVRTFAYPYGGASNFAHEHEVMLQEEGFAAAFSLLPGPLSYGAAAAGPYAHKADQRQPA